MNMTELYNKVVEARPSLRQDAVSRAMVKLRKLAATLSKRDHMRRSNGVDDPISFDVRTDYFYRKAYEVARAVECEFVGDPETQRYWLRIDDQQERIA